MNSVRVIGPKELKSAEKQGLSVIWTVSHAPQDWQRELSPFFLGPVPLYGGYTSVCMENAWQYAKLYAEHADSDGNPTLAYWEWAERGWARNAVRYPMGKGAKPLHLLWEGQRLGYVEARRKVYWPLYRDAVAKTSGFARLQELHAAGDLVLFDFDGYDNDYLGMTLHDVAHHTAKPMGHAFVLKAMLLHGVDVAPENLKTLETARQDRERLSLPEQGSLF